MEMPPIQSFFFDRKGGAALTEDHAAVAPEKGMVWTHVRWEDPVGGAWLKQSSNLPSEVLGALTAPETRPRCTVMNIGHSEGVLINLRGVNLHHGAEPEDMISIRIWAEGNRVISVWRRQLFAVNDILNGIHRGKGPTSSGDFIAKLALWLADRAEPIVAELNEQVDTLEEHVLGEDLPGTLRSHLGDIRRTSIILRRFMFPQRDALSTLAIEDLPWLSERDRGRLREATDRITRLAEELDAIRERASIVQDQLMERRSEMMNHNMMILAVVAAIFLPLGLLTGLLGINVGGIPGANVDWAFWAICGLLLVITCFQLWLFRRLKLI